MVNSVPLDSAMPGTVRNILNQRVYDQFEEYLRSALDAEFRGGFLIEYDLPVEKIKSILNLLDALHVGLRSEASIFPVVGYEQLWCSGNTST